MTHLPSWAIPGRKVVCVDAKPSEGSSDLLRKGQVYTIGKVEWFKWLSSEGLGVHLIEVARPPRGDGVVAPYALLRFRPLVTLEDDMLTFRSLLNTVPAIKELTE